MVELRKGDYLVTQPKNKGLVLLGTFAISRPQDMLRPHEMLIRVPHTVDNLVTISKKIDSMSEPLSVEYLIVAPLYPSQDYDRRTDTDMDRIEGIPMVWRTTMVGDASVQEMTDLLVKAGILRDPSDPHDIVEALLRTDNPRNGSVLYRLPDIIGGLHPEEQHTIRRALLYFTGMVRY